MELHKLIVKGVLHFKFNGVEWIEKGDAIFGEYPSKILGRSIKLSDDGNILATTNFVFPSSVRFYK